MCLADRNTIETWHAGYSSLTQTFQRPIWSPAGYSQSGYPNDVSIDEKSRSCIYVKRASNYGDNYHKTVLARTDVDTGKSEDLFQLRDGELRVDRNGKINFVGLDIGAASAVNNKTLKIISGLISDAPSKWILRELTTKQAWESYRFVTDDLIQFTPTQKTHGRYLLYSLSNDYFWSSDGEDFLSPRF